MTGHTLEQTTSSTPVESISLDIVEGPDAGRECPVAGDRVTLGSAAGNTVELLDRTVSRYHVELTPTRHGIRIEDLGSTNGTFVGAVRVERAVVPSDTLIRLGKTVVRARDGRLVDVAVSTRAMLGGIVGESVLMRRLMAEVERAAPTDSDVLIFGETGTGKELVAEAIHGLSDRRRGPLVTLDCGAITPGLVASELFGHERGAFTGADRAHAGAFERASGGTLFLDEIGELPMALQPMLLGVLERRSLRRVGGTGTIEVDVRVVAATHRDVRAEVNSGTFRPNLYYRLAVVTLRLPPLRARREDIPLLVAHFAREAGVAEPALGELFSAAALRSLAEHYWPGNVRELRNLVHAAVVMGGIAIDELATSRGDAALPPNVDLERLLERPYGEARGALLERFERDYLTSLLDKSKGVVARAARMADIDESHLITLLQRHGLGARGRPKGGGS